VVNGGRGVGAARKSIRAGSQSGQLERQWEEAAAAAVAMVATDMDQETERQRNVRLPPRTAEKKRRLGKGRGSVGGLVGSTGSAGRRREEAASAVHSTRPRPSRRHNGGGCGRGSSSSGGSGGSGGDSHAVGGGRCAHEWPATTKQPTDHQAAVRPPSGPPSARAVPRRRPAPPRRRGGCHGPRRTQCQQRHGRCRGTPGGRTTGGWPLAGRGVAWRAGGGAPHWLSAEFGLCGCYYVLCLGSAMS